MYHCMCIELIVLKYFTFEIYHSCQPLLGVDLSPQSVNLYLPYAGRGLLFFHW